MLPSLQLLEKVSRKIMSVPNRRKESKRGVHYGLFLLGYKSGLRVNEAISFDLDNKSKQGLYRIEKPKGKKERLVYIPKKVIRELKKTNWKPNQTNRYNFYHFLKKIKRELNVSKSTELTPHTLRRAFTTYHAENGLPLPLLQKLLGHSSIRTTALYWQNIHGDNDTADILAGKNWLEKPKKPQPEPKNPIKVSLDKLPEPLTPDLLLFSPIQSEHLTKIKHLEEKLSQIQSETKLLETQNNHLKVELTQEKEQNTDLQQDLTTAKETIKQLEQQLTTAENNLVNEKQSNHDLHQQLQTEQENNQSLRKTNANLASKNHAYEKFITNLQNAYQNVAKDEELAEKQLNHLTETVKKTAFQFYQLQKNKVLPETKISYYKQLEKEQSEQKAQTVQSPPFRSPNK